MKKLTILFLVLALAASLCACGGSSGGSSASSSAEPAADSEETAAVSEVPAEAPAKDGEYDQVFTMPDPFDASVKKTVAVTHQTSGVVYDLAATNFSDFKLDEYVELNSGGEAISSSRYYMLNVPAAAPREFISSCEHLFLGMIVDEDELPIRNVTVQGNVDNAPAISMSLKWDDDKGWGSSVFMAPDEYKAEYQSSDLFQQYDTDARSSREMDQLLAEYTGS